MSDSGDMGQFLGLAMKTHCAIFLVYHSSASGQEAVIATAFAARLPNPNTSGTFYTLIFASIKPKVDNDIKYYTKLSNGEQLYFQQCSGLLVAKPSQRQLKLVEKCLELDEPLAIAGNGTLKKIYVAQANSEDPKKYVVEKMAREDGKYRLVLKRQQRFDQSALFVGAPIVNCYSNLLNKCTSTTKKLVGMITSISSTQHGTTFLVVEFTDAFVRAILLNVTTPVENKSFESDGDHNGVAAQVTTPVENKSFKSDGDHNGVAAQGPINNCHPPDTYDARVELDKKIQAVEKNKVLILHGPIGTGKSFAALHYITNANHKYAISWYLDCSEDKNSIHSSLFLLAKKLYLEKDESFFKLFDAVEEKSKKENVIFLLDNLKENQCDTWLKELWKIKDSVYIIATTNHRELNLSFPDVEKIPVDTFDEAVEFLKEAKEASAENKDSDVDDLCEHFSCNILGLTTAKLYITEMKISIPKYLEMLHDKDAARLVRKIDEEKLPRTLYAAVRVCLEDIDNTHFPALAAMSFIRHDSIPDFLLSSVFTSTKRAPLQRAYLDGLNRSLLLKSLVHITNESQVRFFSFHQFTQSVVYDLLSEKEDLRRELVYKMAGILVNYFNKDNRFRKDAFMLRIMARHAEVFLKKWTNEKMDDRTTVACARLSELVGFAYTQGTHVLPASLDSSAQHFNDAEGLLHRLCGITGDHLKDLKSQESTKLSSFGITDSHISVAQHLFEKLSKKSSKLSDATIHELAFSRTINSNDLSLFPDDIKNNSKIKKKVNSFEPLSEEDVEILVRKGTAYTVGGYKKLFLPELYLSLIYSFGRNYFYFPNKQSVQQPSEYVDRLKLAHCLAREITKRMKSGDAVIHEYLSQSNALLYFLVNREVAEEGGRLKGNKEHCHDLKTAIECYRGLIQEEKQFFEMGILKKEKGDKFSQMVCRQQVVQCYLTLVSQEMTPLDDERNQLIKDGANECETLLALVYAQKAKNVEGNDPQGLQQFSKFLNVVGEFYLATKRDDLLHHVWRIFIESAGNAEVNKDFPSRFYIQALIGITDLFSRLGEKCFAACKVSNLQLKHCYSRESFRQVLCQQQPRIDEIKKRNTRTVLHYYWRLWRQVPAVPKLVASQCDH